MATRERAIQSARDAYKRRPMSWWAIYRIGGAWMYTSEPKYRVQSTYKREIKDWTLIKDIPL